MSAPTRSVRGMAFGLFPKNNEDKSTAVDAGMIEGPAVYVAAASSEMERAKRVTAKLKEMGYRVISTWIDTITNVGDANPMHAPVKDRQQWSMDDLNQVLDAQVMCLLLPPKPIETIGAYVEFGFALAFQMLAEQTRAAGAPAPERYILTAGPERSIFTALSMHFATDDEMLAQLAEVAKAD